MPHILLTGAGFSRNWGGFLANEAFEYLLGAPEINDKLRQLLWKDKLKGGGFEDTLARLQGSSNRKDMELSDALMNALVGMFNAMGKAFTNQPFEFQNGPNAIKHPVRSFLVQFDAIFTLNQDTLLELKYLNDNITKVGRGRRFSTANRRANATIAFFTPRRLAICIAQALSQDHRVERTRRIWAAS